MISQTTALEEHQTQRTTPPIQTFLRVIVVSFVALTLFAIPREGAVQPPAATRVIVGSGIGGQSKVRVFDGTTAAPLPGTLGSFTALTQNPGGEVRVAGCDFNGDGTDDLIASPGLGKRAEVRVFNGATGAPFPPPLGSFLAFESGFLGGVHLACGDLTGDSIPDIIAARGALAKPEVRVFNGAPTGPTVTLLRSFLAFEQKFLGGVRVAACDLNPQDGKVDIVAARGPLGQPEVRAFEGVSGTTPFLSFLAFAPSDRGGVYVACGGDLSGDTIPDIIAGKGLGKPPEVRVFNSVNAALLRSFLAFDPTFAGGVRVASCNLDQLGTTDIIAGRGPAGQPEVRAFEGVSGTTPFLSFNAFAATFKGGVYVACSPNDSGGGGPPEIEKAPEVASTTPSAGATGVTTNSDLTITFDEPVAVTGDWFQISCPTSGPRNVTLANTLVTGGPTTWTINPNTDFAPNEICSTTIVAAQVTDVDSNDPPNNMAADFTFGFTTEAAPSVSSTVPPNGATSVAVGSNIIVNFSESVTTTASTFGLECPAGTPIPFVVSPAPPGNTTSYTLNPNADLPAGTCTIKVTATQVTDVDTNDPPDTMVADFTSTFTSGANNPPSFTKGPNQTDDENAGPQTVNPWATAIDDGDPAVTQALTFNITGNTNLSLFSAGPSVSPTGVLTYTPAANASGTASITLTLSDDGGTPGTPGDDATSAPQTFTITVNAVNNAPTFVAGPDQSVNEDSAAQTVSPWATGIDDGDPESTQTVSFIITGNTNSGLFSAGPSVSSSGALSYTPAANAFGAATITLVLKDDGGTANPGDNDTSAPQSFTITINAVNDPPSFTVGPNQMVSEDAGPQTVSPWATAISPGPANESGQTVSFNITGNTNLGLFSAGPTVTPGGALSYTPAANANGSASIMLVIQDSGGGTDTSAPQGFTITVTAVNDPPQVTPPAAYLAQAHIAINIPDGATDLFDGSTITDVDGPGAAPFSITAAGPFASTNGGSVTIAGNGSFTYNPPAGFTAANDSFLYQICDSGVPGIACTNATATVAVSGPRVWFVDNTVGSSGDGRLSSPFITLTAADTAASASTDRTFVYTSGITYTGGFGFLGSQQRLIGQGVVDTNFDIALGITPPPNSAARPLINGTRPTINGTITLATGGTARGFNVSNTTVAGVTGSGATGLTVNQVSVTTTTGTAVNLLNSGGTVSFQSVSANGATNGIVLNTTTGSFAVTGTGTAGTGGTIQNTTLDGISLTSAQNVSFDRMNIQNTPGSGINGTSVTNFSFTNGTVSQAGNAGQESAIAFNGSGSLLGNNIAGTLTVTGNSFTNPFYSGLDVQSDNGTVSNANVSNNTVTNPGFSGINFVGTNNASTVFNLTRATVNQNNVSGSGGNGIQFSISASNATGPGATGGTPGSATDIISITNNSVSLDGGGTQAITVANSGGNSASRTRTNFLIECNGKNTGGCVAPTASPLGSSAIGTVVLIGNNGFATMTGTVNNNVITATHTPNAGGANGIGGGNGVAGAGNAWTPDLTLTVTNNTISGTDGNGILLVGRGTTGIAKMKITGNTVGASVNAGGSARQGIRLDAGNPASADDAVCVTISSNTSAGSNGAAGIGIRKEGAISATINDFGITGLSPSPATGAQAAAFVATQNPAGGGVDNISGAMFVSCTTAPL